MSKEKYYGDDGKTYDNAYALARGNSYARMEKQKAEDIQKQNKLLEQNIRMQEQIAKQNYELEMQKEHNKQLEANKQRNHEKEMRLLKLFDDAGISKKIYDKYIEKNFMNSSISSKIHQMNINQLKNSKYNFLLHEDEYIEKYVLEDYIRIRKEYDIDDIEDELKENCYTKLSGYQLQEKEKELKTTHMCEIIMKYTGIAFFVLLLFGICAININEDSIAFPIFLLLALLCLIAFVIAAIWRSNSKYALDSMPNKSLDYDKYNKKILEEIKKTTDEIEKIKKELSKLSDGVIKEFYNFRLNHYNSIIEKLLDDVEYDLLVESFGHDYKRINNSNKKNDGTIEDYIDYFENHS